MSKPKKPHRARRGLNRGPRRSGAPNSPDTQKTGPKTGVKKPSTATTRLRHFYDVRQYAVLTDEAGHILILQLPKEYDETAANTWTLPGGKLEPTDNPAEGLLREIAEETGLTPTMPHICGIARWTTRASKKLGVFYRTAVKGTKPALKLSDEHQRAVWVTLAELDSFPFHRTEMVAVVKSTLEPGKE